MFGVRTGEAAGSAQFDTVTRTREDVLKIPTRGAMIKNLGTGHDGNIVTARSLTQTGFLLNFPRATMARRESIEAIAECFAEIPGDLERLGVLNEKAAITTPECDEASGMTTDLVPVNGALTLGAALTSARDQSAEVGISAPVHGQEEDGGSIVERDFRSEDERDTELARLDVRFNHAVDAVPIRERHAFDAELLASFDKLFGMGSAFEKGKIALTPEG